LVRVVKAVSSTNKSRLVEIFLKAVKLRFSRFNPLFAPKLTNLYQNPACQLKGSPST
jgi:hypothetical protein